MISKYFSSNSSGAIIPPSLYTPGSVLFAAADGTITEDNARFFYDDTNNRLGIGINSALIGSLHVRGAGSTNATQSVHFENSSGQHVLRIFDDRTIIVGPGSAVANTNYTINGFGPTTDSDFYLQAVSSSNDNVFRLSNAAGTNGGASFRRNTTTRKVAINILGGSTISCQLSSGGGIFFRQIQTLAFILGDASDFSANFISGSNDAVLPGMLYSVVSQREAGHHFLGYSRQVNPTNFPFFSIQPVYSLNESLGFTYENVIFKINPTYNFIGTSIVNAYGLDYNPTVTALNGQHYGFLFRPSSLKNGIGLGLSMPTALLHLAGSTTTRASLRIESGVLPTGTDHKDGDFTYDGTDINFRQSTTTKKLEFQPIQQTVNATTANTTIDLSLGNVIILNLQVATTALTLSNLKTGTYIIIVKQDGTGGRLMTYTTTMNFAGGVSPILTATANASDIFTIVYDGTNVRTAVSQNYSI